MEALLAVFGGRCSEKSVLFPARGLELIGRRASFPWGERREVLFQDLADNIQLNNTSLWVGRTLDPSGSG